MAAGSLWLWWGLAFSAEKMRTDWSDRLRRKLCNKNIDRSLMMAKYMLPRETQTNSLRDDNDIIPSFLEI